MFEAYIRNLIAFKEANPGPEDEQGKEEEEEEEEEKKKKKEGEEEGDDEDEKEALIALLSKLFGSNIKDSEEKKEFFDSEEEFSQKVDKVAQWMKECKHIIMFTGAGISTRYSLFLPLPPLVITPCLQLRYPGLQEWHGHSAQDGAWRVGALST